MTSFEFEICEKDLAGAEHITDVNREIVSAFVRHCKDNGITKSMLADRLGVNKSVVTKMLSGKSNLTLRSVGELCWAIDVKPEFRAVDFPDVGNGGDIEARNAEYAMTSSLVKRATSTSAANAMQANTYTGIKQETAA